MGDSSRRSRSRSRSPSRRHREKGHDSSRHRSHRHRHSDDEDDRRRKHRRDRDETEEERKERKKAKKEKRRSERAAEDSLGVVDDDDDGAVWVEKSMDLGVSCREDPSNTRNQYRIYPPLTLYLLGPRSRRPMRHYLIALPPAQNVEKETLGW